MGWGGIYYGLWFSNSHFQASLWYTDKLVLNFGKPLHNIAEEFQSSILKGELFQDCGWSHLCSLI